MLRAVTTPAPAARSTPVLLGPARTVVAAAQHAGRDDLAALARGALARSERPTTVVAVVGEFKQGKSALVNALAGAPLVPVDDDVATAAITVVADGEPGVVVHARRAGVAERLVYGPGDLRGLVTETVALDPELRIERVEVTDALPRLAGGLTLVDTPGAGGVSGAAAAATLAFLPFADALIVVTDATAELSGPELDFLVRASSRCPHVVVALTKIDLAGQWRRIAELDAGHLAARGLDVPIVGVSSELAVVARQGGDEVLLIRSGLPALDAWLDEEVLATVRATAAERARRELAAAADELRSALAAERVSLADDAALEAEITRTAERAARLRAAAMRWQTVLGDRGVDLNGRVSHQLRGALRELQRQADERVEVLRTAEEWEAFAGELQASVGDAVADAFAAVAVGSEAIREELAELLGEPLLVGTGSGAEDGSGDLSSLWGRSAGGDEGGVGAAVTKGTSVLRGAQGGVIMLGFLAQMLPAGAAAALLAGPVVLAVGGLFAGQQLIEQRKRRVAMLRQQARVAARQFLDAVLFDSGNALAEATKVSQRALRDDTSATLTRCSEATARSLADLEANRERSVEQRSAAAAVLAARIAELDVAAAELAGPATGAGR